MKNKITHQGDAQNTFKSQGTYDSNKENAFDIKKYI
jgi:hypothetical protein